jgi:4-hydroxy-4-methyl-2-oxoglutarate aldolase
MRLAAPAFPVRCPPGDNLWIHRAVYAARAGEVLVVDTGGGFEHGYWGQVLTAAALARGLAGLVIHGDVRDSQRLVELGWPVFAERVCIRGTGKDPAGDGALGQPMGIGDVEIHRGDLIDADADGVVCVAAAHADRVRQLAAEPERAEVGYRERLRASETTLEITSCPDHRRPLPTL